MSLITKECVLGVETDVYRNGNFESQITPATVVLFIGGNPGTLEFYEHWLTHTHSLLSSAHNVHTLAIGHANHHLQNPNTADISQSSTSFDLEFQIQHKIAFIKDILLPRYRGCGEYRIVLIGHSIGAYILLTLLARMSDLAAKTSHVLLLMPFIRWTNMPLAGRTLLSGFNALQPASHNAVAKSLQTLISLPSSMRKVVLGSVTGFTGPLLDLVADRLLTMRLVGNFLTMGSAEISSVPRDQHRIASFLRRITEAAKVTDTTDPKGSPPSVSRAPGVWRTEVLLLYTDQDMWAPASDALVLSSLAPELHTVRTYSQISTTKTASHSE